MLAVIPTMAVAMDRFVNCWIIVLMVSTALGVVTGKEVCYICHVLLKRLNKVVCRICSVKIFLTHSLIMSSFVALLILAMVNKS